MVIQLMTFVDDKNLALPLLCNVTPPRPVGVFILQDLHQILEQPCYRSRAHVLLYYLNTTLNQKQFFDLNSKHCLGLEAHQLG